MEKFYFVVSSLTFTVCPLSDKIHASPKGRLPVGY